MSWLHEDEIMRLRLLSATHPNARILTQLADAYRKAGDLARARDAAERALDRHPEYTPAYIALGRVLGDLGETDGAERAFRRALELEPENRVAEAALKRLASGEGVAQLDGDDDRLEDAQLYTTLASRQPDPARATTASPDGHSPAGAPEPWAAWRARPWTEPPDPGPAAPPTKPAAVPATATRPEPRPEPTVAPPLVTRAETRAATKPERRIRSYFDALLSFAPTHPGRSPATAPTTSPAAAPVAPPRAAPVASPGVAPAASWGAGAVPFASPDAAPAAIQPRAPAAPAAHSTTSKTPVMPFTPHPAVTPVASAAPAVPAISAEPAATSSGPSAPSAVASAAPGDSATATSDAAPAGGTDAVALVDLLVGLLEYRDPFYRGGSSLARLIAVAIGREMGLDEQALQELGIAALLRDLGRLALGGRLIEKPSVELKPEARRRIEGHVDLALELLEGIALPESVRAAVRHHHERWDGMGYPDGLRGDAIPLPARILAVADSLAAMISPRPYRPPRRLAAAVAEIEAEAGTNYDPAVVHALLRILPGRLRRRALGFGLRQHVVVVDADRGRALATAVRLCSHGYLAEAASDPDDARERMRRYPVDLVAISSELPDDAGAAFLDALRDDDASATLPVVMLHADDAHRRIDLLRRGADACFATDVAFDEFLAAVGAMLKRANGAEESAPAAAATAGAATGKRSRSPLWHTLQGDLQEFPLSWLLQVLNYDSRTAAIVVRSGGDTGMIYVEGGAATHAEAGELAGDAALQAMLRWSEGSFSVRPNARAAIRTVERSIMHLLLDTAVEDDHGHAASIFGAVKPDG